MTSTTVTTRASKPAPRGGAHLDARFHIGPGGTVTPAQIALPSGVPIALSFTSSDTHIARVTLDGGPHSGAELADGASATFRIDHLPKGAYRVLVDGRTAAQLVIGVAPGP